MSHVIHELEKMATCTAHDICDKIKMHNLSKMSRHKSKDEISQEVMDDPKLYVCDEEDLELLTKCAKLLHVTTGVKQYTNIIRPAN